MDYTPEMLAKAKAAKSAEELRTLAAENGITITEEEAKAYFAQLHKEFTSLADAALADEELENVSGGSSCKDGRTYSSEWPYHLITTAGNSCPAYIEGPKKNKILAVKGTCWHCALSETKGWGSFCVTYCLARTKDDDPYR